MKGRKRIVSLVAIAFFIFILAGVLSFATEPMLIKSGSQFDVVPVEISSYDLNDLGIVDANHDNNLDIFTTNHSSQQSLLLGSGRGTFEDVFAGWGLSQDQAFPQLENSDHAPAIDSPGLYIYRQRNRLHLVAYETEAWGPIRGAIELSAAIRYETQSLAETSVEETVLPSGVTASTLEFSIRPGGHLSIKTIDTASRKSVNEIPHSVQLDSRIELPAIFVGQAKVNPASHQFDMLWRDRHSMAWSDMNADEQLDVFVARGGIHGQMAKFPEQFADELFVNQGESFDNEIRQASLEKDSCPARQSAWVDYDKDGRLDIFVACGRSASDGQDRPHQLFHQLSDRTFENVSAAVGLDLPRVGEFEWLDVDLDGQVDVVATQDGKLAVYYHRGDRFIPGEVSQLADRKVKQFTVVDFDQDGRFDTYLAGRLKSYLIRQTEAEATLEDPTQIGLPGYGLCANWVDYDNDGLSDLHVIPGGLYRQQPDHTFVRSHLLSDEPALIRDRLSRLIGRQHIKRQKARCSWFDYNNDGFRDLVVAQQQVSPVSRLLNRLIWQDSSSRWQVRLFKNKGNQGPRAHWLALNLKGQSGNPEAIGASIQVETPLGTQRQRVGSAEGSHFSQGHYRLYFGLGDVQTVDKVTVNWPNGQAQILTDVSADQLIDIAQANADAA